MKLLIIAQFALFYDGHRIVLKFGKKFGNEINNLTITSFKILIVEYNTNSILCSLRT